MSAYDAGKIEASADLDRDPFQQGLHAAIREGEEFAAHRFTATADIDIRDGEAALDRLKAKAENFGRQKFSAKVDLDVSGNVRFDALIRKAEQFNNSVYKAKVTLDAEIAFLKLDDIEARLHALATGRTIHTVEIRYNQDRLPNLPTRLPGGGGSSSSGDSGGGGFSLLGTAAVGLLPALLPLLPLAASLVGEFGMVGIAGMLAFKGVEAAEKGASTAGQQFRTGIGEAKHDLAVLEATAARNILAPFSRDVQLLNQQMPFLNSETGKYARILGNTTGQLFEGAINSIHVLDPLLTQVSGWVYSIASGFNRWTSDGGLQRFEDRALQVLPQVEHTIGDIATALVDVTRAAGPFGMTSLRALDMIAQGIDSIPLPVLKVLVATAGSGYLAFQAWRGLEPVVGIVKKLTGAIVGYEAAQMVANGATKVQAAEQATVSGGLKLMAAQYGSLGLAVGLAGAATLGIIAIDQAIAKANVATAATSTEAAAELRKMASSGEVLQATLGTLGVSSKSLNSVFENTFRESNWTKIKDFDFGLNHLGLKSPVNNATNDAKNFFKSVDDGLTQMMVDGDKAAAQNAFKIISDQAARQGITVDQLLDKLPKYKQALDSLNAAASGPIVGLDGRLMATSSSLDQLAAHYGLTTSAAQGYVGILGITSDMVKDSTVEQSRLVQVLAVTQAAERTGTQTTTEYMNAVDAFAQSAGSAADRAALISATLKAANGDALTYANTMVQAAVANQQLVSGLDKQQRSAINLKTGVIDYRNAAAGPLLSALSSLQTAAMNAAGATYQHEVATRGAKRASDDAVTAYYAQTHGALMDEAKQLGLTKDQARRLADQYFSLPADIKTKIEAIGTDPVLKVLDQIGRQLAILTKHPWVSQFDANTDYAVSKIQQLGKQIAGVAGHHYNVYFDAHTNGTIPAGGASASLSAYGNIFKYGFGGFDDVPNNHQPAVYPVRPDGRVRVFAEQETGGEAYIPLANDSRRPRARSVAAQTVSLLGGAAYFADGGFGFVGVQAPVPKKPAGSRGAAAGNVATSFNGRTYSSLTAAEAARASLGDSLDKALTGELTGLGKLATATEATVTSSMNKILATVRQAVSAGLGPSRLVASLQAESRQLIAEVAARTRIAGQLAAAQKAVGGTRQQMADTQSQVAQGIIGGFDFGTAGNGYSYGISSTLDQRVADAQKFKTLQDKARALGLDQAAIDQMAREGPQTAGANLQAIVTAGSADRGYITHLNSQYAALSAAAQGIGASDAQALYGKQLAAQEAAVARDTAAMRAEQRAIHQTLHQAAEQLRALQAVIERQTQEAHRLAVQRAQQHI